MCENYGDIFEERMMNNGELILPDIAPYSRATVIKIAGFNTGIDRDKSSMMCQVLDHRLFFCFFLADCFFHSFLFTRKYFNLHLPYVLSDQELKAFSGGRQSN